MIEEPFSPRHIVKINKKILNYLKGLLKYCPLNPESGVR